MALALLAVVGPGSGVADALSGKQSYLYVALFDDGVDGRVEMPAADLGAALDTEIPPDVAGARNAIGNLTERIHDYVEVNASLATRTARTSFSDSPSMRASNRHRNRSSPTSR